MDNEIKYMHGCMGKNVQHMIRLYFKFDAIVWPYSPCSRLVPQAALDS